MLGQGSGPPDPVKSAVTSSPQHVGPFQCCSETQITELSNDSSAEAAKTQSKGRKTASCTALEKLLQCFSVIINIYAYIIITINSLGFMEDLLNGTNM